VVMAPAALPAPVADNSTLIPFDRAKGKVRR
jgi:hypothetical protein